MPFTTDTTLAGRHVRLVPLRPEHHDDLVEAVRDGELWKLWYTAIPTPEGMAAEIQRRCQRALATLKGEWQGTVVPGD